MAIAKRIVFDIDHSEQETYPINIIIIINQYWTNKGPLWLIMDQYRTNVG